jgi:hypothetical protein
VRLIPAVNDSPLPLAKCVPAEPADAGKPVDLLSEANRVRDPGEVADVLP